MSTVKKFLALLIAVLLSVSLHCTGAEVLLVANTPLDASDTWIKDRVTFLGHNVTVVDDNAASVNDAAGKDMILISSSIDATVVAATFKDINLPVMLMDVELQAAMGMTGSTAGTDYGTVDDDRVHIIDHAHPMAANITGNRTAVEKRVVTMGWGKPNDNAIKVAKVINNKDQMNVYEYPPGAVMANGQAAPDRRIFFFAQDTTELNATGIQMFDAAIAYALSTTANVVTVVATDSQASEEGTGTGTFTVSRSGSTKSDITVSYTITGTAATDGSDYAVLSGTITIPANSSSATITVTPVDDAAEEGDETVIITLSAGAGFTLGSPSSATVTIVDNDTTVVTPTVDAGTDKFTSVTVNQDATVTNATSVLWSQESGQGKITFGSANAADTTITANQEGLYVLRLTATGSGGGTAFDEINFTWDTTPPVFSLVPQNSTVEATSAAGAVVNYAAATATDNLSPLTITYSHATGDTFPLGVTTVTVTATDAAGNVATATFTITVSDTTAPALTASGNLTLEATGPTGAVVNYSAATATDAVSTPTVTYSKPSGDVFPLGSTTVTVTATDAATNSSTATFTVNVVDTTAPVITVPADVQIEAATDQVVNYPAATATDAVSTPTITYSKPSGDTFPIGETTVTVTATDAANNTSTATFKVVIAANLPPLILSGPTATPNPAVTGETITFTCTASDSQAITWVWNFGDGTPNSTDASTTTHAYTAAGPYTVTLTVTDASNQSTIRTVDVTVNAPGTPPPDFDGDGTPDEFDADDDNDGVSDVEELAAGTNPLDAGSNPKKPMTITKVSAAAKFNAQGKDQFQVTGIIPNLPKTFTPLDKNFVIDLGGASGTFKLDAKGRAKTATGTLKLKIKTVRNKATKKKEFVGGPIQFQVKLKGALGAKWTDEGVDPTKDKKKVSLPFVIDVSMDGTIYTDTPNTVYSSKAQKGGAFKFSRKVKL